MFWSTYRNRVLLFLVSFLTFEGYCQITDPIINLDYQFEMLPEVELLERLTKLEDEARQNRDTLGIVRCTSIRSRIASRYAEYEKAFKQLQEVKPLVDQSTDELVKATYFLRMGNTLFYHMEELVIHQQSFDEADVLNDSALVYLSKVITPAIKIADPLLYFKACYTKAQSLRRVARDEEALENINNAENLVREHHFDIYKLDVLNVRAGILEEIGRVNEANNLYLFAIQELEKGNDDQKKNILYSNYGTFLYMIERDEEALFYLLKSDSIADLLGEMPNERFDISEYIHELYSFKGDYELAYLWSQKALAQYKEIETGEMRLKFEQMQIETANFENERLAFEHAEKRFEAEKESQKQGRRSLIFGSLALFILLSAATIFFLSRLKAKNAALLHEREVSELIRQQEISSMESMIEGQETERKRLGRELHDHIGSMLSTLGMHFTSAFEKNTEMEVNDNPEASRVLELLDNTVQETRKLSHDLMTGVLNRFGLVSAIRDLCDQISETGKVSVLLNSVGMEERLDPMIELNVYRISQELISNALKHAAPSTIRVNLVKKQKSLSLTVKDDGIGLTKKQFDESKGAGSTNVKGRIASMHGKLELNDQVDKGTAIKITIPLKP